MMTVIFAGLAVGSVYALVALTFNITMVQSGIFNFAQAQFVVLGGFLAYAGRDLPVIVVLLGGAAVGGLLGYVEERVAVRTLAQDPGHGVLVTTVGFSVLVQGIILVVWDPYPLSVPFALGDGAFTLLGGRLQPVDIALLVTAVVLALALDTLSGRTRWGISGQAATYDRDAAASAGLNVLALRAGSFALAAGIGCALGPLTAPRIGISANLGFTLVILGFCALAVGGFGSYWGSLVGGLIIGLVQAFGDRYLGVAYPEIVIFVVLLTVLLMRPTGLMGRTGMRAV
jgi:branched-chain amino acid transport system permease protein